MELKKRNLLQMAFLAIVTIAVFAGSLRNGFVWDDNLLFIGKKVYKEFDLYHMWFSLANGVEYLPLRDMSYGLDYLLWGERAWGFHLTNLLLHVANAGAVYLLTAQLVTILSPADEDSSFASRLTPLLASLAFAVHPLQVQAVNFITCRNTLLSGWFFLLACLFYVRYLRAGGRLAYTCALLSCLAAFLSKATALSLPLVLLLLAIVVCRRGVRQRLLSLVPFFILAACFFIAFREIGTRTAIIDESIVVFSASDIAGKLSVALQIPLFYLGKLLVPVNLSAEYDTVLATSFLSMRVLVAFGVLAGLACLAILVRRRFSFLGFSLCWFIITLLPVMHFFPTTPVVADRYAYLPIIGFTICLATFVERLKTVRWGQFAPYAACVLIAAWSAQSIACTRDWLSDVTLWSANIRTAPKQAKGYGNLAATYWGAGENDKLFAALDHSRNHVSIEYLIAYYRGMVHAQQGDLVAAKNDLQVSLDYSDKMLKALYALGYVQQRLGNYEQAAVNYNKALLVRDLDASGFKKQASDNLAAVSAKLAPQLAPLRNKVAASPDDVEARLELALRLDHLGFYDEALTNYQAVEQGGIVRWQLYYNMANVYKQLERFPKAATYYVKSLAINPGNVDALNNLGVVYRDQKEYPKAISAFQRALERDNRFSFALYNLGTTYFRMGDRQNALRTFERAEQQFPELAARLKPYLVALHES